MRTLLAVKALLVSILKQPSVFPVAVFFVVVCLPVLGLTGCAGKQVVSWQDDKEAVYQSLAHVSEVQAQLDQHMSLSDKRILALEKKLLRQEAQIQAMQATLKAQAQQRRASAKTKRVSKQKMAGKNTLKHKIDQIDADIQKVVVQSKTAYKPEEKDDYTAAYLALKSGRYDEAIDLFHTFLNIYPNGEYVDQAYYWLGESLLAKGEFLSAVEALRTLTRNYPQSSKYQVGLLKLGMAYEQAGRLGDARAVFQRLLDEAPDSKAARQAQARLAALHATSK